MLEGKYKQVKLVLWLILLANILVAVTKIVLGTMVQSASMTADGFHSLSDGTSNIVGLIGIWLASQPVDKEHPYGHNKFETMAGLLIAAMLFVIAIRIVIAAIARFTSPVVPQITAVSLLVLCSTLLLNIFVAVYEYRKGRKLQSAILISDSMHTRSDIFVSVGVLLTLGGVKLGLPAIVDPIASVVVAGFILHAAFEIFKSTCDVLLDKAVVDAEQVCRIVKSFPEVLDVHKVRSRGSAGCVYIDMHIKTEAQMSVQDSHHLTHQIEARLQEEITPDLQAIIHIEPFIIEGPSA